MLDPNYISVQFASVSSGYLSTAARNLPTILHKLPEPTSERERAIEAAIMDGVRNPARWERNQAPIKFKRNPSELLELVWGDAA